MARGLEDASEGLRNPLMPQQPRARPLVPAKDLAYFLLVMTTPRNHGAAFLFACSRALYGTGDGP
jgi:hypothetical protein